ncbi:formate-dependent phosphoribosylglycinamide formyltransferase [Nannocystis sp.]|uniref:formate-dependent phosphoribosylglycinamide formyltransferase n=1 Tax=Nannocystis sp. TaxID=1962667 RepID=UPI0025E60AFC|nr:formate-dependent phosphoribosylglycinamide formyltransferase [Nannocystis sp.]MBK7826396.1 formate-dependent phosphoribosylglycinamide formyltransferase [Nannocystis sp.]
MDLELGTPLTPSATRMLLLGSGELGREVALEAMRLGVEVIACDRYRDAPAMQVAHRSHVFDMQDRDAVRAVVGREKPHYIVPEVEAIATDALVELEAEGWTVIPTARATRLTMDREGIRRLAAEQLELPTSPYAFADSLAEVEAAVARIGLPCVIKPVMSSSGKGQSTVRELSELPTAWDYALAGARGKSARVIVEGFVRFDSEITLLTIRTRDEGTLFCPPIGHRQERGDYMESWQPHAMSATALERAQIVAETVTEALGGVGLFGVELFLVGDEVIFSEVSPRPHDTGMVTMTTQDLSEFELHVRAILGLPIVRVIQRAPGASSVILAERAGHNPRFLGVAQALQDPRTRVRLFAKPDTRRYRRMGVVLTYGDTVEEARARANAAARGIEVVVDAG